MKHTYLLIITLSLSSFFGYAQSPLLNETKHWTSVEDIDLYTGHVLTDTFYIDLNNTVLTLKNSNLTKNLQIENVQGNWASLSAEGQLTFNIVVQDFTGVGSVQNQDGVLSLVVDLSGRKDWMKRKFIIKN